MKLLPIWTYIPNQLYIVIYKAEPRIVRYKGDNQWEKLPNDPLPFDEAFVRIEVAYELVIPPIQFEPGELYHLMRSVRDLQEQIADSMDQPISIGKTECTTFPEAADFRMAVRARLQKELKELLTFPVPTYSQF